MRMTLKVTLHLFFPLFDIQDLYYGHLKTNTSFSTSGRGTQAINCTDPKDPPTLWASVLKASLPLGVFFCSDKCVTLLLLADYTFRGHDSPFRLDSHQIRFPKSAGLRSDCAAGGGTMQSKYE